jgi:hypothetical protein
MEFPMLNCFSGVFLLTPSHKIVGNDLLVVARCGESVPTLRFTGKQKDTIVKWGKPNRMIAVSGSVQTEIVDGAKMTFIDVAYSRFLDKAEETTVKAETKAAPKAETKTKASAKAEEVVAATSPVDDEVPW